MDNACFYEVTDKYQHMKSLIPISNEKYIYHYTSSQGLLGIIENGKLRFSDRNFLNDKSEGNYVLDLIIKNIDSICPKNPEFKKELVRSCIAERQRYIKRQFHTYQCSFSIDKDNLSLWNYYTKGDSIKGYNIQFDTEKLIASVINEESIKDGIEFQTIHGRVVYDEKEQINILRKTVDYFYDTYEKYHTDLDNISFAIVMKAMAFGRFFKMGYFSVENEYRISFETHLASMKDKGIADREYFREINGYYVPYIENYFSLDSLISVTMSPTLDYTLTETSLKRLFQGKNKDIAINKSDIPVRY